MSQEINLNFLLEAQQLLDARSMKAVGINFVPYISTTEANTLIDPSIRSRGLFVLIDNGSTGLKLYWYKDDTTNNGLILFANQEAVTPPTGLGVNPISSGDSQFSYSGVDSKNHYAWQKEQYKTYILYDIGGSLIPKVFDVPFPGSSTLAQLPDDTYIDIVYAGGLWSFKLGTSAPGLVLLNNLVVNTYTFQTPGWYQFVKKGDLWYQAAYERSSTDTPWTTRTGNFDVEMLDGKIVDLVAIKSNDALTLDVKVGLTPGGNEVSNFFPVHSTNPQPISLNYLINGTQTWYFTGITGSISYKILNK